MDKNTCVNVEFPAYRGDIQVINGSPLIYDGEKWVAMEYEASPVGGRTIECLVAKLREIETLYEIADQGGLVLDGSKAKEYNTVEEELIRRGIDTRPMK